jgi:histidinol-phosphate aminotransferase
VAELSERVRALVQPQMRGLEPYDPDFAPCRINLSANENDLGLPAPVRARVDAALRATPTNRYPDPMANELRDEIASWHGVSRANVFVSDGGDEALFDLFLAFGGPGRTLVNCPPTFSVYALYASMLGTTVLDVPRDPETFAPNADELAAAAADAAIVVLTSPNNPTGDVMDPAGVARVCEACPGLVLADEAYGEFAGPGLSSEPLLAAHDNLVVLHTFSKAYCLAGARCGYLLAAPDVVDGLAAVRQPYSVGVLAQAAALAVARERAAFEPLVDEIRSERERLLLEIRALGRALPVRVWPSQANFLLVRVPNASRVRSRLRDERSILVRDFSSAPGLADCLRITVGTREENDELLGALEAILKEES